MKNKIKSPMAFAAAFTLYCSTPLGAAVTLIFAQVGPNVIATWSGNYHISGTINSLSPPSPFSYAAINSQGALGLNADFNYSTLLAGSGVSLPLTNFSGDYSGDTFGFSGGILFTPQGRTGSFSPSGFMTFTGVTLAELGAGSFSNTIVYTGSGNTNGNRQIRFNTVPEPASVVFYLMGSISILAIRKRHH
ncbi:MAG: hypothetical protein ACRCXD_08955 [Luteolibacter sp.]